MDEHQANSSPPISTPLNPTKRLAGIILLFVVIGVCGTAGWMIRKKPDSAVPVVVPDPFYSAIIIAAGFAVMACGVLTYFIATFTNGFTFRFDRPFMPTIGMKLWLTKLVGGFLLQFGFAIACFPVLIRLLSPLLGEPILLPVVLFTPFVVAQLLMVWVSPAALVERRVITRRLNAMGCPPGQYPGGILVGMSDPKRSSLKRFPIVESDMGMIWLMPGWLIYRGDRESFDLTPRQVLAVERKADGGSTSSYFGAVHVILRIAQPDGSERQIRLHTEGKWTLSAEARALNELADRLWSWKATAALTNPPQNEEPQSAR